MEYDNGTIIIESTKEKNEELKQKWQKINSISSKFLDAASISFWITLLSPFDLEGPLIEVVAAVVSAISLYLVKKSDKKLEELGYEKNSKKR